MNKVKKIFDKFLKSISSNKRYAKIHINDNEFWEPFNYRDEPNCQGIEKGDFICIEALDETIDYIYQMVYKKDGTNKSGRRILWQVLEKYDDDVMLGYKKEKIFLKHSDWIGPNVLKTPKVFLRDEARYAFFKVKNETF